MPCCVVHYFRQQRAVHCMYWDWDRQSSPIDASPIFPITAPLSNNSPLLRFLLSHSSHCHSPFTLVVFSCGCCIAWLSGLLLQCLLITDRGLPALAHALA